MPQPAYDPAERRQQLMDRLTEARKQGVSWDAIHTSLNNRVEAARKAGVSDLAIQQSLGYTNPDELIAATQGEAEQHLAATKPTSWVDAVVHGWTHSSTAALLGITPSEGEVQGRGAQITAGVAETLGDVPAIIVGGIGGAFVGGTGGAAAGGATGGAAGSVVGPEGTVAGGAGGAVVGAGVGAYIGAGAGGNALPQLIKSERDRYVKALNNGEIRGPEDFLNVQALVMKDTGEAAAVGGLTGAVGGKVVRVLDKMGASKLTKFVASAGAETGTMVTAQSALAGQMPRTEDFVDAAITIGAFHTAAKVPAGYRAIRERLQQNYVRTGELPAEAAQRATADPVFRAQMLGRPEPKVIPAGSSRTMLMSSTSLPALRARNLPQDTYIVPRVAGDFDHALPWMFKHEGGMTTDTGGLTKYGISQKAHPGIDIANLSREDAAEIYHKEYWRAIDADALPPNMRLAAFDSAVNQGVPQTKVWLKEANGDLQKFMQLRVEKYARLARDPKYAPYAKSWANRLKDLGASEAMADILHRGPDNIGKEFTPVDKLVLGLDDEGGGGGKLPPSGGSEPPSFEPGDEGSMARIKSRVAADEGRDWLADTIDTFKSIYGELFDPTHPIRKLVDGVTKGEPLDDYHNPELLFHAASGSNTVAKWAVKKEMVDLDGNVVGPGLEDIISGKSVGVKFSKSEVDDFLNGYALAKWALMMEEQGKKTGIDPVDARKAVADQGAKFEKSFEQLVGWRNGTLKWLGDSGIHDRAKVEQLIKENGSTIPGYRRMEDGSYRPVNTGKPGIWNPIKKAEGSERQIEPILKSLMQDAFLRHQLASNNRALAAIADLGIKGNEATQKRMIDINVVSAIEALKEQGISEDVLSDLAKSAGKLVPADHVPVFRDGKLYSVKFEDKDLTRLLRGYDQTARGTIARIASALTSVPRNMQTKFNPLFPIRNAFYDMVQQAVTNPDAIRPLSAFYDGLGHMVGDQKAFEAWGRSGAAEHIFTQISNDAFIKSVMRGHEDLSLMANVWNVAKSPFDALTAWARIVSIPPRLSRFTKGIEKGETPLRAAVASSETATPPVHYGGPVGRAWNSLAPYTVAYLNGLEKTFRAIFGVGHTPTGVKYDWQSTFIKGAAIVTMPMIAQWYAHKDEDWYKAMPDWQKNNAWFIVPPVGDLPPIPVAAPPLISTVFITVPRMLMERFAADNPHAFDHFWGSMGASLMPPNWITGASIITPIVEHYANFSFFRDRPLVDQNTVRGVAPAEQFTPYSSPAAKDLAQFASDLPLVHSNFGWSPAVIDNYISQWGGPLGRNAANAAAALLDKPSNPPVEQKVSDWPGISSWTVRYPSANAQPIQTFYDRMTQLDQMHGSLLKTMREGDFERFKKIVDEGGPSAAAWQDLNLGQKVPKGVNLGPYYDYLRQKAAGADRQNIRLAHQAADALKNARDYSWSVYQNHDFTSHDKRQKLDMTNAQMQVMSERGNEALDRALIGVKRRGASAQAQVPDSIRFDQAAIERAVAEQ